MRLALILIATGVMLQRLQRMQYIYCYYADVSFHLQRLHFESQIFMTSHIWSVQLD